MFWGSRYARGFEHLIGVLLARLDDKRPGRNRCISCEGVGVRGSRFFQSSAYLFWQRCMENLF